MNDTIRSAGNGGNNGARREVAAVTRLPLADGLLADMLLTKDQSARESLAEKFAVTFGRGIADNPYKGARMQEGLAVAARLAGHPARGDFVDNLRDVCAGKAWPGRKDERSARALAEAEADVDAALAEVGQDVDAARSAMRQCLGNVMEGLGRDSDLDLDAEAPALVARARLDPSEIPYLLMVGGLGRDERQARARRAHEAELDDRQAERLARKKAGKPRFDTYLINPATGRAVADEEFEAAEIAKAEAEHAEAATLSAIGNIGFARKEKRTAGAILLDIFATAYQTRNGPISVEDMTIRLVEAANVCGAAGRVSLIERAVRDGRACATPARAELAASRLMADTAGLGLFVPADFAEPVEALAEIEAPSAPVEVPATPAAVPDDEAADVSVDLKPRPLSALTRPPGLVGEIVDWIEATAEFPSRELGLAAALAWVGALAGRGFETPSQARTNLYVVCLAPSGFGKDHAPSCISELAQAAGFDRFLGPARFMSSSALRNEVMAQPSMLAIQDEYGGILRQIDGPKVGIHNEMIRYDLLGLFSRAKNMYPGAAYAGARAVKLFNPNLCVLGLSTPDDFFSALSSSRSQDGFLGRYILFNIETAKPPRTKPTMRVRNPPQNLIDGCTAIYQAVYGGGNLLGSKDGSTPFKAKVVDIARGATEVLEALEIRIGHAAERADYKVAPFWQRAYEHSLKLALTVAIGVNPARPVITGEIMSWAGDLAWASASALCSEAENRMADNDRQRNFNRIIEIVRRAGAKGLPLGKLVDKLGGTLDKRTRSELIEEAVEVGRIFSILFTPATGRPGCRFVAPEFRPNAAG